MRQVDTFKSVALGLIIMLGAGSAFADTLDNGFYTIIGPDGRPMQVAKPKPRAPKLQVQQPAVNAAPVQSARLDFSDTTGPTQAIPLTRPQAAPLVPGYFSNNTASGYSAPVVPEAALGPSEQTSPAMHYQLIPSQNIPGQLMTSQQPSIQSSPIYPSSEAATSTPITVIDGVSYVDTEVLEQKAFNLDDKKRFYPVRDGTGQILNVEHTGSAYLAKPAINPKAPEIKLSANYQRLSKAEVQSLSGLSCVGIGSRREFKLFGKTPLSYWIRDAAPANRLTYIGAEYLSDVRYINVQSFSPTEKNPAYYWPVAIFLDEDGCVLEGASQFFQQMQPASFLERSALLGTLLVPKASRYVLLVPLEHAQELPATARLISKGQLILTAIRR